MTTWKKRVLAAAVLAFGMATTIATSPIEFRLSETATGHSEGGPIDLVAFMDAETGAQSGMQFDLQLDAAEDPGAFIIVPDDPAAQPITVEVTEDETGFHANYWGWANITCFEGAERCSHVVTIEPENPVAFDLSGSVDVTSVEEFAEDAIYILDVDVVE